jgi:hypothetical protein
LVLQLFKANWLIIYSCLWTHKLQCLFIVGKLHDSVGVPGNDWELACQKLRFGKKQKFFIQLVAESEMKSYYFRCRSKWDCLHAYVLTKLRYTSRAVFSFFKGLNKGSVFLVFFMMLIMCSIVKSSSIDNNKRNRRYF